MVFVTKFRANDLNPSKGKQIEFNAGVVQRFFGFTEDECKVSIECHSLADKDFERQITATLELSPARGDYKIYQNDDGSKDLKDVFLVDLNLTAQDNIDDYYAIKKKSDDEYVLYYVPKDLLFKEFFPSIKDDQLLIADDAEKKNVRAGEVLTWQQIVYGAPGTGKSFGTEKEIKASGVDEKKDVFRTTFHPDSDYSTFVGAYKPTKDDPDYDTIVQVNKIVRDQEGKESVQPELKAVRKSEITYDFVPQAFIRAYVAAWKKYVAKQDTPLTNADRVYLVIEEINRGHCAQIFGDLFQLLDRNEEGFSDYPIDADTDLAKWLYAQFEHDAFDVKFEEFQGSKDADGKVSLKLSLPPNLYIRATMNTSDQSLFPMDSAFKRRWDWKYVPISPPDKDEEPNFNDRKIVCKWKDKDPDGNEGDVVKKFDWWKFLDERINPAIFSTTKSEDKQLGYFFVKVPNDPGEIPSAKFAGKVLFYLYNDVFKDYNYPDSVFAKKDASGAYKSPKEKYLFKDFFDGKGNVKDRVVAEFFENLGMKAE